MTEQTIWGISGAVAGIAATATASWWTERAKHSREQRTLERRENRKRCESFLASVESEVAGLLSFEEQHGVFPIDEGHEATEASARAMLTDMQINCPPKIHMDADSLASALEEWAWGDGTKTQYEASRASFIAMVRARL